MKVRNHIPVSITAVLGVVTLVTTIGVYTWLFIQVDAVTKEIEQVRKETQLVAVQNTQMHAIRKTLRDTSFERVGLESIFVQEEDIVSFLESAESLENITGAETTVQSVGSGEAVEKDGSVRPLKMTIRTEGTLQDAYYTLALLETFPKVLYIKSARFTQPLLEDIWIGEFSVEVIEVIH